MQPHESRGGGHAAHAMPVATKENARALKITGVLTGIYFVFELGIGLWTGSVAVISDAFHTFSAVGGVLVALVAGHFATRPASQYQTFGLIRAEIVGALVNGLFLLGMAIVVFWMGYMRLRMPQDVPTGPMLLVAAGGLVTELISMRLLYGRQKGNLNMKGAFWHVLQTFVGSLTVIVAALVIRFTGFVAIDPLLGMGFGLVLIWASWDIIRDSMRILLDAVPRDLDLNEVQAAVSALPGVRDVHHAHAWALTTGKNIVSMHVMIGSFEQAEELLSRIQKLLYDKFHVYFSTVQLETHCSDREERAQEIDVTTPSGSA